MFNTGSNSSGMALTDDGLGHGAAESPGAAGFVESKLNGQVARLGARVRFAAAPSGSVALVGWQSSLVDADRKGTGTPATGMRLVASPGRWELTVVDGEVHVIGSGVYDVTEGPATFEVVRDRTAALRRRPDRDGHRGRGQAGRAAGRPVGVVGVVRDRARAVARRHRGGLGGLTDGRCLSASARDVLGVLELGDRRGAVHR